MIQEVFLGLYKNINDSQEYLMLYSVAYHKSVTSMNACL